MSTWREIARKHILRALEEAREQGLDEQATKKHVSAAYPFGIRQYHPYKIWLDEVKKWLSPKQLADPPQPKHPIWQKLEEWKKLSE